MFKLSINEALSGDDFQLSLVLESNKDKWQSKVKLWIISKKSNIMINIKNIYEVRNVFMFSDFLNSEKEMY